MRPMSTSGPAGLNPSSASGATTERMSKVKMVFVERIGVQLIDVRGANLEEERE